MQRGVISQQVIFIIIGVVALTGVAGAYYIGTQKAKSGPTPTPIVVESASPDVTNTVVDTRQIAATPTLKPTATPTPTPTATPTPKATLKPIFLILPTPTPTPVPIKINPKIILQNP